MNIIRNVAQGLRFEDLRQGEVFITTEDDHLYMKTSEAYEYPDDRDHYFNAVHLEDGSLIKINDWEEIRKPKKAFLTVED